MAKLKHLIQIERELREKLPGVELSYRHARRHHILCVVFDGKKKHVTVSSSPTQPEHAVANTVRDMADCLGPDQVSKLVLIEDTSSPVPGFEALADQFLSDLRQRGMRTAKAVEFYS